MPPVRRDGDGDFPQGMILVVEDDSALLELIRKRLAEHGYPTAGATSAAAALSWLRSHAAELMLLDYMLPDMVAAALVQQLRAEGREIPFVVATAHGSEELAVQMMKQGARDYLIKGASFLRLLPTVVEQTLAQLHQEARLAEAEQQLRESQARLQQAHDELEERVRQRTAELAEANVRLRVEIEERRWAEELARQRQAELEHVARLNTVGEMVAELAHELSQPLSAIALDAQACLRLLDSSAEDGREALLDWLAQIGQQAERAGAIIGRLRRFAAKGQLVPALLDLNGLIRGVAELVAPEARIAGVQVRFELREPLPPVLGDRIQLEQVLINLIRNAFEALAEAETEPRELTVRTFLRDGQLVEVTLHDTGIGPPPGDPEIMFQRFFSTKPGGIGMGLPISRSIIENHGGRLWAAANADRGATFRFTLPAHQGDAGGE